MNWPVIEAAIALWLSRTAGEIAVQWANQRLPEPVRPYGKLKRTSLTGIGMDEQRSATDLTRVGEEVELMAVARREFSVSCHLYASPAAGADAAADLMERAKIALSLETTIDAFTAAGIAVVESGPVNDIPESRENSWSSRAQMDVRFYATSTATERATYIEKVELVNDATGETFIAPDE